MKPKRNKLVDVQKIKEAALEKYGSIPVFGETVLGISKSKRQLVTERLEGITRITADELFIIADDFGLSADDLRLKA